MMNSAEESSIKRGRKPAKNKALIVALLLILILLIFGAVFTFQLSDTEGVKSQDVSVLGTSNTPGSLQIASGQSAASFTSPVFEAEFEFNAIAPHWNEEFATNNNRTLEIRISQDGNEWTQWLEVEPGESGPDGEPESNKAFVENPLFITGKHFQYRTELSRNALSEPSPRIYDLRINYIDSRKPKIKKAAEKVSSFFKPQAHAEQSINIVSRKGWDNPDPYGKKFKGKDKFWSPAAASVEQVFLHHTATSSSQSDPEEVMRGIWDYHANTLGWGDIGYNYVIDQNGTIYEGRFGGDNVIAGHVRGYNTKSLGVAVLGCFQPGSTCDEINGGTTKAPSSKVINNLTTLLSWKTTSFEIDPQATHTFCNYKGEDCLSNLPTIAAHRDANNTSCNGQLFYDKMSAVRDDTATKNNDSFKFSAKQLDYATVDLSADKQLSHQLSFKNTGTTEWSSSAVLKTANPSDRTSDFRGDNWVSGNTLATLGSAVAPGETGAFTFDLKRPKGAYGHFNEGVRLVTEDGTEFKNFFNLHIHVFCTFGTADNPRPNGTFIRNPNNGRIFWLENGEKRHITSPVAARTNRLKLSRAVNATSSELNLYPTGNKVDIHEGTVVKSKNSTKLYVIDQDGSNYLKRHIANPATLKQFDLGSAKKYEISGNKIKSFSNGSRLDQNSIAPDGLLVKSDRPKVYIVEDGKKRWINHGSILRSYRYSSGDFRRISQNQIDKLTTGKAFNTFKTGTVFTTDDTVKVFAADTDTGEKYKRWVLSPRSFSNAQFHWSDVIKTSNRILDQYTTGERIVCHK